LAFLEMPEVQVMKSAIFCEHANESPVTRPCRCSSECYCKAEGGCRPHRAEEEFVATGEPGWFNRRATIVEEQNRSFREWFGAPQRRVDARAEIASLRAQLDEIERRIG
jgi:hypothetical protein